MKLVRIKTHKHKHAEEPLNLSSETNRKRQRDELRDIVSPEGKIRLRASIYTTGRNEMFHYVLRTHVWDVLVSQKQHGEEPEKHLQGRFLTDDVCVNYSNDHLVSVLRENMYKRKASSMFYIIKLFLYFYT